MTIYSQINAWLEQLGLNSQLTNALTYLLILILLAALAWLLDTIARVYMLRFLSYLIHKTPNKWDDVLLERKVFNRLSHLFPAVLVYLGITIFPDAALVTGVQRAALIYIIIVAALFIDAVLTALHVVYQSYDIARVRPIKGYVQALEVVIFIVTLILIVSTAINQQPTVLLGALGAFTAVLMLVFKDLILGFVAGIQLTSNNMVRQGDWIVVPDAGADGDVIDISLLTVSVQNWDKTITTVPIYRLISQPFTNWRGMSESGGRRIKRAIYIDINTVRFLDNEDVARLRDIVILRGYLDRKLTDIDADVHARGLPESDAINRRRLTNVGTFRAYIDAYLKNHPMISQEMTFLIRQLQPDEKGLPIEIYVFSKEQRWVEYENIQSDIFDHLLAVLARFDLRVFQMPGGREIGEALKTLARP